MCKRVIWQGLFFRFLKILLFETIRGVKGQKMVQNNKIYCHMIVFLVHMCKMTISPEIACHFKIFTFLRKRAKNNLKLPIRSVGLFTCFMNCRSYHQDFCYTGVKQWYLQAFFNFFFFKSNIVNIEIILLFIGPLQHFF